MSDEMTPEELLDEVRSDFNKVYYFLEQQTWKNTRWMGSTLYKYPTDLWIYQEIMYETRPTLIVETGTARGGSALFMAQVGEHLGGIRVVSVDVNNTLHAARLPRHARVTYLTGSSVEPSVVEAVRSHVRADDRVMVILDSDHAEPHVRAELAAYAPLVTPGCYLIVEDTAVNGHPVLPDHGPGPMEALAAFLPAHPEFEVDRGREKFLLTQNPSGYLRKRVAG